MPEVQDVMLVQRLFTFVCFAVFVIILGALFHLGDVLRGSTGAGGTLATEWRGLGERYWSFLARGRLILPALY